ncbi:MAG: NADP-dependent phosphogluconate dehydrogenase [Pyrinomonadaceae bacterium]
MEKAKFGIIGLGTMGRNFLLNVADSGFSCSGFDVNPEMVELLNKEGGEYGVVGYSTLAEFLNSLETPRNIMLLVPAGEIVDAIIHELTPHLTPHGLVIDAGNSHFPDTERRETEMESLDFHFLGVGVSGGAEGARRGPSIMVGGNKEVYERVRPIFEAVSAQVGADPCAAWLGTGSAGHFVKMVHNGIEYGLMELICEAYDFLKRGLGLSNAEAADVFGVWNSGNLQSFLIEITEKILRKKDDETGNDLVDMILDTAGQLGTGKWTSQVALDMGVPVPTIDTAVSMRQISALKMKRTEISTLLDFNEPVSVDAATREESIKELGEALFLCFIITYTQGMALLTKASGEKNYNLKLADISRIWRGGCIIRSSLLEDFRKVYAKTPDIDNLLESDHFKQIVQNSRNSLLKTIVKFNALEIPSMAFSTSSNYLTAFATARLPANLLQAQRDFFGAHTYRRIDKEGIFTTHWEAL